MRPTNGLQTRRGTKRKMVPSKNEFGVSPRITRSSTKVKEKEMRVVKRVSYRWELPRRSMFFKLCHDEYKAGNRSRGGLTAEAYDRIAAALQVVFGDPLRAKQVRNFWGQMKAFWNDVKKLVLGTTGLGLDLENDTVAADDEWWELAIQEKPELAKLRDKNIKEVLYYGDILFRNCIATGEHVVHPSTIPGSQVPKRIACGHDLILDRSPLVESGSCRASPELFVGLTGSRKTPMSSNTKSSKCKSLAVLGTEKRNKKQIVGALNDQREIPSAVDYMPLIEQVRLLDHNLAMYGATLLAIHPKFRWTFLCWPTAEVRMEWLQWMWENGKM